MNLLTLKPICKYANASNNRPIQNKAIFLFAATILLILLTTAGAAVAATITVDDSGGAEHTTIQSAINAATGGDTITVAAGTYVENVVVNKTLTLQGAGNTTTIIDGFGSGNVVEVTVNGVTINDFRMQNGSTGVYVTSDNNAFSYNVITDMQGSTGSTPTVPLSGSSPFNGGAGESSYGFYLLNSDNNDLAGNSISNIMGGRGGNGAPDDGAKTYQDGHGGTGGLSSGIYFSNSNSNSLSANTIANLYGGNGGTGGSTYGTDAGGNGGTGGQSWSIYISGSQYNNINGNSISNMRGGNGGTATGFSWRTAGTGGNGGGIYLLNSNNNNITGGDGTFSLIYGGVGGSGGGTGQNCAGGNGGNAFAIVISNSLANNISGTTFTQIYGRNGGLAGYHYASAPGNSGAGGHSYGFYLSGTSGNNILTDNALSTVKGGNGANGEYTSYGYKIGGAGGQSYGIYLSGISTSNNLSGNTISSITGGTGGTGAYGMAGGTGGFSSGFYLTSSNSNDLIGNTIFNIYGGTGGTGGTFTDGTVGANSRGIYLLSSTGNTFIDNTITNAVGGTGGAAGGGGISDQGANGNDYSIYLQTSLTNTLYHNYFNSNPNGYDDNATNVWDNGYPSGGNRWSDYGGVDGNSDGIGDTNYLISGPGGAVDNYPLKDSTDPIISSVTINDTLLKTGDPLFVNVSATDENEIATVTADGVSLTLTGGYYVGPIPAGTSPVTVIVTDDWGNSATNTSATYSIDDVAPTINFITINGTVVQTGTPLLINVSATDANGIVSVDADGVSLSLSGGYYTGTISASTGNVTVNVTDVVGNVATNTSTTYTIDDDAPTLNSVTLDDYIIRTGTIIEVNVSLTDAHNIINVTADGTTLVLSGGNYVGTIIANTGNVTIVSTDEAGNVDINTSTNYTIDNTQPGTLNLVAPTPDNSSYISQTFIVTNISVSDANLKNITTYLYYSNGSLAFSFTNTSSPAYNNITGLVDGYYFVNATAWDEAGNSNISVNRMITLDTTKPANMEFRTPTPNHNSYLSQTYIPSNITTYDIYLKNMTTYLYNSTGALVASFINTSSPALNNFTSLPDDYYFINNTARDWAGNSNTTVTRKVTLDTTKPVNLQFLTPTPNHDSNLSQNYLIVNVTSFDINLKNVTTYLYNSTGVVAQVTNNIVPAENNFTGLDDGVYYTNFTVYDLAGNSNMSTTRKITLDTTKPGNLEFVTPTPNHNSYLSQDFIFVNVTTYDIYLKNMTTYLYNITGALVTSITNTSSPALNNFTSLPDDYYFINNTARDWAGNYNTTVTRKVTLDTTKPANLEFLTPTPNHDSNLSQSHIVVNVTSFDINLKNVTTYIYNSTGTVVAQVTNSTVPAENNFTGLDDGVYYTNFTVYDLAGNSNMSITRKVTLDITPPSEILFLSPTPENDSYLSQDYIVTNLTAQDIYLKNVTTQLFSENSTLIDESVNTTLPAYNNFTGLGDGIYYIKTTAYDFAGNSNFTTMNFTIDTIDPVVNITTPLNGHTTYASYISVEGTVNGTGTVPYVTVNGASAIISINSSEFNGTYYQTAGLSFGYNIITVETTDQAGNTNNSTISIVRLKEEGGVKRLAVNNNEDYENIEITDIQLQFVSAGQNVLYRFNNTDSVVTYIGFHALTNSGLVQSRIDTLINEPGVVNGLPSFIVYGYFDIQVGNNDWANGRNMEDVVIGFRVVRAWINEHNIEPSTINMQHYVDGQWVTLTTILTGEDDNHLYFEVNTSGFSPFAITGNEKTDQIKELTPTIQRTGDVDIDLTQEEDTLGDGDNMFKLISILGLGGIFVIFVVLRLKKNK